MPVCLATFSRVFPESLGGGKFSTALRSPTFSPGLARLCSWRSAARSLSIASSSSASFIFCVNVFSRWRLNSISESRGRRNAGPGRCIVFTLKVANLPLSETGRNAGPGRFVGFTEPMAHILTSRRGHGDGLPDPAQSDDAAQGCRKIAHQAAEYGHRSVTGRQKSA